MRHALRFGSSLLLAAVLISPVAISGCAERASYRVYDHDHDDYHRWNHHETTFYFQWETETHREHRDFDKRHDDEQREYWKWRHDHH